MLKLENAAFFFPWEIFIICTKPYSVEFTLYAMSRLPYVYVVL